MSKTVFIVDNSASLRRVMEIALTGAGYEVIEAADGRDALTRLAKLAGKRLNLIICASTMPSMGGFELVEELKKNLASKFAPVVLLIPEDSEEIRERARALGVKATIVKPFHPAQLLRTVDSLIRP